MEKKREPIKEELATTEEAKKPLQNKPPINEEVKSSLTEIETKRQELEKKIRENEEKRLQINEKLGKGKPDSKSLESTPIKSHFDKNGYLEILQDPKLNENKLKHIAGTKDTEIAENIVYTGVIAIEPITEQHKNSVERFSESFNIIAQGLNDFQPKDAIEARLITQASALFQHGMDRLGRAGRSGHLSHSESQTNMAIKFLRCHNETIETLNRYRRGGEQKVIVQHVNADKAIVNNFPGGGVYHKNKGDNPCSESAELRPEQITINHVDNPQWPTAGVDCTVDCAPAQRPKKDV